MKISESIFHLEDSPEVSQAQVTELAQEILDRYKKTLISWGYEPQELRGADLGQEMLGQSIKVQGDHDTKAQMD
jgi:hypothetical protein